MKYVIGIDIGGTTVKMGLFQEDGVLIEKSAHHTDREGGPRAVFENITVHLADLFVRNRISLEECIGVGVGVPGPVMDETFTSVVVNLGWENVDVGKELNRKFGLPVKVANDANIAALGEMWQGAGAKYDSLVLITLGTGIGGGVVYKGEIVSGAHGVGGEIGHMPILEQPEERTCGCGKNYCIELVASATGIKERAAKRLRDLDIPSALRNYNNTFDARAVFKLAEKGDEIAKQIVYETGFYLGKGCAIISSIINPEVFVIGGGVSNAGETLLEPIRTNYQKFCFGPAIDTPIIKAMLGNDAGIYGAARLMLTGGE